MKPERPRKTIPIKEILRALLDESQPFPANYLPSFSDLDGPNLSAVKTVWLDIPISRRLALMEDLNDLNETDTTVLLDNIARLGLEDTDDRVRTSAARLLWETEDPALIDRFVAILDNDPSQVARAAGAAALGRFVYLGELEDLDAARFEKVVNRLLLAATQADSPLVRRNALASLGYSSRPEVAQLVQQAYDSGDVDWVNSALVAMARSGSSEWEPAVKRLLNSPNGMLQISAIRAAGELELSSTRRILLDLLEDEGTDSEIRAAVIWSLSQIGGEQVREALEALADETDDEEESELLDEALENLNLTEMGQEMLAMFDFDIESEDEVGGVVDLERPDDDEDEKGEPTDQA